MRFWKKRPIGGDPIAGLVVATYRQTACLHSLLSSLQAQTYKNFRVLVVHDGPWETSTHMDLLVRFDERFSFVESGDKRMNVFGHNSRAVGLAALSGECDYIGTCSGDAWYCPVFFEAMLHALQSQKADFCFCDMVHSHKQWLPLKTELKRGGIDVGCFMANADLVSKTPWESMEFAADWFYIDKLIKKATKIAKVKSYLYVHN